MGRPGRHCFRHRYRCKTERARGNAGADNGDELLNVQRLAERRRLGRIRWGRGAPPPARLHRSGGYTWRLLPPVSKRADQAKALYVEAANQNSMRRAHVRGRIPTLQGRCSHLKGPVSPTSAELAITEALRVGTHGRGAWSDAGPALLRKAVSGSQPRLTLPAREKTGIISNTRR